MTNTLNRTLLTIALAHGGNLKVQTALLEGRRELARDYLAGYVEQQIADAHPGDASTGTPAERAAAALIDFPGPLLHKHIREVVNIAIP